MIRMLLLTGAIYINQDMLLPSDDNDSTANDKKRL